MPNFFVIGANRAGTTSLHKYLDQHPAVYMSPVKEPNYFHPKAGRDNPRWPNRATPAVTLDEYRALFAGVDGETAIGESSTVYLSSPETPERIRLAVPDAKLVAVLRNPADRRVLRLLPAPQVGDRGPVVRGRGVRRSLDQVPASGRMRGYVMTGFYGRNLSRYLEVFDRDRLRVYLYEDLMGDPDAILRDLFRFLEVDPWFAVNTTARHNATPYEPKHATIDRVARASAVKSIGRRLVSDRTWARAREYLRRTNSVALEFPDDVRRRLIDVYRDDIALTESIIGRDLSAWTE